MTISASMLTKLSYRGNGSTTAFPTPYFEDNSWLVVVLVDDTTQVATVQTITTHYTLSGVGNPSGGTCTMLTAPPAGQTLVIYLSVPISQLLDFLANDNFPSASHESGLDKITLILKMIAESMSRASVIPIWSTSTPPDIGTIISTESVFVAQLTSAPDSNNAYEWEQAQPLTDTVGWQATPGGLTWATTDRAIALADCGDFEIGAVVVMLIVPNSSGTPVYRFLPQGACT